MNTLQEHFDTQFRNAPTALDAYDTETTSHAAVCRSCGALIAPTDAYAEIHTEWHTRNDDAAQLAARREALATRPSFGPDHRCETSACPCWS